MLDRAVVSGTVARLVGATASTAALAFEVAVGSWILQVHAWPWPLTPLLCFRRLPVAGRSTLCTWLGCLPEVLGSTPRFSPKGRAALAPEAAAGASWLLGRAVLTPAQLSPFVLAGSMHVV